MDARSGTFSWPRQRLKSISRIVELLFKPLRITLSPTWGDSENDKLSMERRVVAHGIFEFLQVTRPHVIVGLYVSMKDLLANGSAVDQIKRPKKYWGAPQ